MVYHIHVHEKPIYGLCKAEYDRVQQSFSKIYLPDVNEHTFKF
jgi:hypothetical protein